MAKNKHVTADARLAARTQAQQQIKAQERRTAMYIGIGAVFVLLLFGGVVFFIIKQAEVPALEEAVTPVAADESGGILIGQDGTAGGDVPEDAPRVDIYEDYLCPACGQFEAMIGPELVEMREAGEIQLYVHPIAIQDHLSRGTNYSSRAAAATASVAEKAPEHIVEFMALMYANQPAQNSAGLSDAQIEQIAIQAGVPEDTAATLTDGQFTKWVLAATDQSSRDGVPGTPAVMVNGELLNPDEVQYFQSGVLRAHVAGL